MLNRKGFIRTLEAVIAIVLILGLIVYLTPERKLEVKVPSNVKEAREFIFSEVLVDEDLRKCVENNFGDCRNCAELKEFLDVNVPVGYGYDCEICGAGSNVGCSNIRKVEKSVYSGAVYLHSDKTFRLFLYEK